jgi:hypothetical protein
MVGNVVDLSSDFCSGEQMFSDESQMMAPFVIAEQAKDCSTVTQVRNMEDSGAALAIIISQSDSLENDDLIDDGTAAGIRIPTILITKKDGLRLQQFSSDSVVLLISFEMFRPDNHVEYDIWFSSSNNKALDFIQDFKIRDEMLADSVTMTPHFKIWSCKNCDSEFVN